MSKEKLTPYETYKLYVALKTHFRTESYDIFKYRGNTNTSFDSFLKRKDKSFFERLSKYKDVPGYTLANIVYNDYWVGEILLNAEADANYKNWWKLRESFTYHCKESLKKLFPSFKENFIVENDHPNIFRLYMAGDISFEFTSAMIDVFDVGPYLETKLKDDILWQDYRLKLLKYPGFAKYKKDELKQLVIDFYK